MRIKILGEGPGIAGYIKIGQAGAKAAQGQKKRPPQKFDHIEITTRARNDAGQLEVDRPVMDALVEAAAEKDSGIALCGGCARSNELGYPDGLPTNLGVYLASDDPEISFPNRLCWYRGRHAYCWGDGEQAERRAEVKGKDGLTFGDPQPHEPSGHSCLDFIEGRCKPDARLRCSLAARQLVGAVYEFRTTSWNSIRNIDSCMKQVKEVTRGTLSWVPLVFSLSEQMVQPRNAPANKAMVATLFFPGSARSLLEAAAEVHTQMGDFGRQLLTARADIPGGGNAWQEAPEEVSGFAAEYHPEERDEDIPLAPEGDTGQASEDAPGASNAPGEPPSDQAASEEPAAGQAAAEAAGFEQLCGQKLPGGRVCTRDKGHDGKHSAKRKVAAQPPPEPTPEPDEEPPSPGESAAPPESGAQESEAAEGTAIPTPGDDRINADLEAPLTAFQINEMRRMLREKGIAAAAPARDFLVEKLGRTIGSMSDLVEQDFRVLCGEMDPKLFDQCYQMEVF